MNSLQEYGDLFLKLNLTELRVEEGDKKLCLRKSPSESVPVKMSEGAGLLAELPEETMESSGAFAKSQDASSDGEDPLQGTTVKAPLLGIFTSSVRVGDSVKRGDALCMIEAMKMMNEVLSPADGTVSGILAGDGELVEFDQKLMIIT